MIQSTDEQLEAIELLCRRYDVLRLEQFGSASTDRFDQRRSDIDLLVKFVGDAQLGPWLSRYFELKEALEDVWGRRVDLVMAGAPQSEFSGRTGQAEQSSL